MAQKSHPPALHSISKRLFLLTAIVLIAVVLLMLFYNDQFTKLTTKRANTYFEAYAQQLTAQIESVLSDTEGYMSTLATSKNIQSFTSAETAYERYQATSAAIDNLDAVMQSFPLLQDIRLLRRDGISVSSSHSYHDSSGKEIIQRVINTHELKTKPVKSGFYTDVFTYEDKHFYAYITPIFSTRSGTQSSENIGVVIALCKVNKFVEFINEMYSMSSVVFTLDMGEYKAYSANDAAVNREISQLLGNRVSGDAGITFTYENNRYIGGNAPIRNTNWLILYWFNVHELTADMEQMRIVSFVIVIAIALFVVFDGVSLYLSITRPIHEIAKGLKVLDRTSQRLKPLRAARNELQEIALNINSMLDRMQEIAEENELMTEKLHTAKLEAAQAELAYYQKQINPHFLYNSMECIRSMAASGYVELIEQFTQSLASVFRYSTKTSQTVTLRQEISCVQNYFNVMSLRFPERYSLRLSIDLDPSEVMMLKMILQPILENSLLHAYDSLHPHIHIILQAFTVGNDVHIRIVDNGQGIAPEQLAQIQRHLAGVDMVQEESTSHLGLVNVHRRLALKYGDRYGVVIRSVHGCYTSVEMVFPSC